MPNPSIQAPVTTTPFPSPATDQLLHFSSSTVLSISIRRSMWIIVMPTPRTSPLSSAPQATLVWPQAVRSCRRKSCSALLETRPCSRSVQIQEAQGLAWFWARVSAIGARRFLLRQPWFVRCSSGELGASSCFCWKGWRWFNESALVSI